MTSLCDPLPSFRFKTYSFSVTHFWEYTHFVKPKENTFSRKKRLFKKRKKHDCVVEKGEKGEPLIKFIWFADSWEARIRHHRKLEDRDGGDIREDYVRYTLYRKLDKINPLPVKKKNKGLAVQSTGVIVMTSNLKNGQNCLLMKGNFCWFFHLCFLGKKVFYV